MILRSTETSPFGRKARMAALHLHLMDRITIVPASVDDPDDVLRRDNPLGKMPALVLDDGRAVYDSRVILEVLDHLAGGGRILPKEWNARLAALTQQALGDGLMDAALLMVYEGRYRTEAKRDESWVARQRGKVERALHALAAAPPDPRSVDVGTITIACALGYLDFRKQVDWRGRHALLVDWLEAFRTVISAFDATRPPA